MIMIESMKTTQIPRRTTEYGCLVCLIFFLSFTFKNFHTTNNVYIFIYTYMF